MNLFVPAFNSHFSEGKIKQGDIIESNKLFPIHQYCFNKKQTTKINKNTALKIVT